MKAQDFLRKGADLLEERGKQYDQPGGERSMGKAVRAFNTITGRSLDESEGWLLLQILKDVRQWQNPDKYHSDSAEDGVSYSALKAEALQSEQFARDGWTQDAIDEAAFKSPMPAGECENWTKPAPRMFDGGPIKDGVMYLVGEPSAAPVKMPADFGMQHTIARQVSAGGIHTDPFIDTPPSWDDAPEWAARLAQDANGKWYWYDLPVETKIIGWEARGDEFQVTLAGTGAPNPNWRDTLQARPTKEAI